MPHLTAHLFLSTLSLRRATCYSLRHSAQSRHFYPRSPCGERPIFLRPLVLILQFLSTLSLRRATRVPLAESTAESISIHALLAESDYTYMSILLQKYLNFYPRSPCGERRYHYDNYNLHCVISIHALLAESDRNGLAMRWNTCISIHALLAESDIDKLCEFSRNNGFLSTLSLRRATAKVHKTVGHFCAYETNFMGIASSC